MAEHNAASHKKRFSRPKMPQSPAVFSAHDKNANRSPTGSVFTASFSTSALLSRLNNRNMSAPKKKGASELDTGSSNNAGSSSRLKPSKRRYVNNKSKNGKKGSSHK